MGSMNASCMFCDEPVKWADHKTLLVSAKWASKRDTGLRVAHQGCFEDVSPDIQAAGRLREWRSAYAGAVGRGS
jgi:hypothetical protein